MIRARQSVAAAALALAGCAGTAVTLETPLMDLTVTPVGEPAGGADDDRGPEAADDTIPEKPAAGGAPDAPAAGDEAAPAARDPAPEPPEPERAAPTAAAAKPMPSIVAHDQAVVIVAVENGGTVILNQRDGAAPAALGPPEPEPEPAARGVLDVLREAEGFSALPYCGGGDWMHIGIGTLLTEDNGKAIACEQWAEHAAVAEETVGRVVWARLNEVRRAVLTELAYMTGGPNLLGFGCLLTAIGSPNAPNPPPTDCEYLRRGLAGYTAVAIEIWDSTIQPELRRGRMYDAMRTGRIEEYLEIPR